MIKFDVVELLDAIDGITYVTDIDGFIVAYGQSAWKQFATENGGGQLLNTSVIGRRLSEFINGEEVAAVYERYTSQLLAGEARHVSFLFRCDSPEVRRELRMSMSAITRGHQLTGLLYQVQVMSETLRPPINIFSVESFMEAHNLQKALPIITICSFCHDIAEPLPIGARRWKSAEEYYQDGGSSNVRLSHGVCAACSERLT